eukprot:352976_1
MANSVATDPTPPKSSILWWDAPQVETWLADLGHLLHDYQGLAEKNDVIGVCVALWHREADWYRLGVHNKFDAREIAKAARQLCNLDAFLVALKGKHSNGVRVDAGVPHKPLFESM